MTESKIIAVDVDGVLCKPGSFLFYAEAQPIKANIEQVNKLFDLGNHIVIYTSRLEEDRLITLNWLKKHGVKFDVLVMEKLRADLYIDDKAVNVNDLGKCSSI